MRITKLVKHALLVTLMLALVVSCGDQQTDNEIIYLEDGSILIPVKDIQVRTVNMRDDNGLKQGPWQEEDKEPGQVVFSTKREYMYQNDTLHGYFVEYKKSSPDTLIYGTYCKGEKCGEWKYWAAEKNEIEKIEIYDAGKLKEE